MFKQNALKWALMIEVNGVFVMYNLDVARSGEPGALQEVSASAEVQPVSDGQAGQVHEGEGESGASGQTTGAKSPQKANSRTSLRTPLSAYEAI